MGFWVLVLVLFAISCSSEEAKDAANKPQPTLNKQGKDLFAAKCSSCHRVNVELAGPALKGVEDRWPDKKKLYAFIRNSEELIQTDKYAHDLWLKFNQTAMTKHLDMTDGEIRSVLDYIQLESGK
eukprot:gene38301-51726_t